VANSVGRRWHGPLGPRDAAALEEGPRSERRQLLLLNLRETLPLFFLAAAALIVGAVLASIAGGHSTRLPLWLLSLAIGTVALGGGVTGLISGDFRTPDARRNPIPPGGYVIVPVEEWEREARPEVPEVPEVTDPQPWIEESPDAFVAPNPPPTPPVAAPRSVPSDRGGVRAAVRPPPTAVASGPLPEPPATRPPPAPARGIRPTPPVAVPPAPGGPTPAPARAEATDRPTAIPAKLAAPPNEILSDLLAELEREAVERLKQPRVEAPAAKPTMVVCVTCLGRIDPAGEKTACKSCGLPLCPRCYHLGEKVTSVAHLCRFCRSR
jgi:hypothetical protein